MPRLSRICVTTSNRSPRLPLLDCRALALILAVLAVSTVQLFAQFEDADRGVKSACAKYEHTPLPPEAIAILAPKRWPYCDSYKFYAGNHTKVDLEAARKCAWSERLASQAGLEPLYLFGRAFGGSAMLTLLYSNGEGVEKNIPLAIRFACESGWAPGQVAGHVEHLEVPKGRHASNDSTFRFCDGLPGSFMEDYCQRYDAQVSDQSRADALRDLSSAWPEPQRTAFAILQEAETAYSEAHAKGEIDTAGPSRTTQELRAKESLRESFLAAVRAFEQGNLPAAAAQTSQTSDGLHSDLHRDLDRVYNKAVTDAEAARNNPDAPLAEDLRDTQEAWIKYRDAWLAFAKLHYSSLNADSLLAILTRDRIATLQGQPCEYNPDTSDCVQPDNQPPRPLP